MDDRRSHRKALHLGEDLTGRSSSRWKNGWAGNIWRSRLLPRQKSRVRKSQTSETEHALEDDESVEEEDELEIATEED